MNKMNTYKTPLILLLLAGLTYAAYHFYSAKQMNDEATQKKAASIKTSKATLTVNTIKPQTIKIAMSIPANGNIAAWQEAIIGAESNGLMLKEVLVNVGDVVKKGQVLARFAVGTLAAETAQAEANVNEAKSALIEAASNASRARSIQDTGALSTQQMEQIFAAEASAKARVAAAEAARSMQNVKQKQTAVLAPDAGVISSRMATVGAVVSPGQELFKLIRQGRLEWRAELTSSDISKIKTGMLADVTLPDGEQIQGKVRTISPVVDSQTRNAIVFVDLPASGAKFGMYARGNFVLGESSATILPASAVTLRDGFTYVMQVDANQYIRQRKVQTGRRIGENVEILDLPQTDANYVASGGAFLADGNKVKVIGSMKEIK